MPDVTALKVASQLPDIARLRDLCRSMAVLEAILSPDWESRYHSFDEAWGPGEEMTPTTDAGHDLPPEPRDPYQRAFRRPHSGALPDNERTLTAQLVWFPIDVIAVGRLERRSGARGSVYLPGHRPGALGMPRSAAYRALPTGRTP
jgi:hypothetical protein